MRTNVEILKTGLKLKYRIQYISIILNIISITPENLLQTKIGIDL